MKATIETTVRDAANTIRGLGLPDNETVRITVGTKSFAFRMFLDSAEQLQEMAKSNGMTDEIYEELMASLKSDQ